MNVKAIGFLFLFSLSLVGCDSGNMGGDPVITFDENDPEMVAAEKKARETVGEFTTALKNAKPDQVFLVKKRFVEGDEAEVMWLVDVKFVDGKFVGLLGNNPGKLKNVKRGGQASVPLDEISDWSIMEEGKETRGGYTIAVMLKRQAEANEANK